MGLVPIPLPYNRRGLKVCSSSMIRAGVLLYWDMRDGAAALMVYRPPVKAAPSDAIMI